jgi:tetratricopeptide (TPR) repeat protein
MLKSSGTIKTVGAVSDKSNRNIQPINKRNLRGNMLYHFKSFLILFLFTILLFTQISAQTQPQTAQEFFEQGVRFGREQKFNEALEAFRQSAKLEPKQAATHANIGLALISLNRATEAVASYREAVRLVPNNAAFHVGLCQSLSLSNNDSEAVAQCEEGVRLDNNSPDVRLALIAALRMAKRSADALRVSTESLEKFRENELLLLNSAELNFEQGNYSQSLAAYEALAQLKPNSVLYQVRLAENYLRLERDSEAINAARKALEIEKYPPAYFFLGKIYFELGQNEEAAEAFQQVINLDGKLPDAYYFLGVSQSRRGRRDKAIAALRQAVALAPQDFQFNKELGSILIDDAQYEEAIAPLKKAAALNPSDFEAKVGLGVALVESAHYEEALTVLTEVDQMKPGNQTVVMFLSVTRARQQGIAQAVQMKQFAKENPNDLNVRLSLAQLLGYARRMNEAEPYIEEIRQMNPKDARVYITLGTIYTTAGNLDKASEVYRKALEIEQNPGAYLGLANIYSKRGQIDEAINAFAKVIELKPDAPNIMKLYADLLRDNGKRSEALEMYKRSLSLLPNNPPAVFNAGILSVKLGDLNAARQYLEILKPLDPQSAKTLGRFIKIQR